MPNLTNALSSIFALAELEMLPQERAERRQKMLKIADVRARLEEVNISLHGARQVNGVAGFGLGRLYFDVFDDPKKVLLWYPDDEPVFLDDGTGLMTFTLDEATRERLIQLHCEVDLPADLQTTMQ